MTQLCLRRVENWEYAGCISRILWGR